jgi:hypothetical protein
MGKKHLSSNEIHAIMNQMEVFMSINADDLVDKILEKRARAEEKSYDVLRKKIIEATNQMLSDLQYSSEIELDDDDMLALGKVTEGLRDLGYKFRFIEVQDSRGETVKHKLLVSVEHLL